MLNISSTRTFWRKLCQCQKNYEKNLPMIQVINIKTNCKATVNSAQPRYKAHFWPTSESSHEPVREPPIYPTLYWQADYRYFPSALPSSFSNLHAAGCIQITYWPAYAESNEAASKAQHTINQLSVGGACTGQGCHGWNFLCHPLRHGRCWCMRRQRTRWFQDRQEGRDKILINKE